MFMDKKGKVCDFVDKKYLLLFDKRGKDLYSLNVYFICIL